MDEYTKLLDKKIDLEEQIRVIRNKIGNIEYELKEYTRPERLDVCKTCGSTMFIRDKGTGKWKCFDCEQFFVEEVE